MLTTETYRTIREARKELREWGRFWQRYEQSGGGSLMFAFMQNQKSSTKYHRRKPKNTKKGEDRFLRVQGIEYPVDARCTESRTPIPESSKDVFVPWSLQGLDDFIQSLDARLSEPLKRKYIIEEDAEGLWLDRAENAVMLRK